MNQTLIRSILKIGGGALIAKGITDESTAETIIAGLVALIGIIWGLVHRSDGKIANPLPALALIAFMATNLATAAQRAPSPGGEGRGEGGPQTVKAADTIVIPDALFRAKEWQLDTFGTARVEDLSNLSEARLGAGVGLNYFPWRAAGFGLEARGQGTGGIFIDHTAASVIGRFPIDKLRLAPSIKLGTDYDLNTRDFSIFAAVGAELRLTRRFGFGAEVRGYRPVTESAAGEHVIGLLFLRANW